MRQQHDNSKLNDNVNTSSGSQKSSDGPKIKHHQISLPKGGGAIGGMGEKFQANPVTGTASFSLPLPITPSRSGFEPKLSLSYDSGSGNTVFGFGWNVDLPTITRKTAKGLPKYQDSIESDTFLISGAEDLVPIIDEQGIKTNFYQPRIEGLFARIEKIIDGDIFYWKATTKEGVTSYYGQTENSRIVNPDNSKQIFQWLIEKTEDAKGNIVVYKYKDEDLEGVDNSINERQRLGDTPLQNITNKYINKIHYGIKTDATGTSDDDFHFTLLFDYQKIDDIDNVPIPVYDDVVNNWDIREDPFSSFKSGFEIRTYRLCRQIIMFHRFDELGTDPEPVKRLIIKHDETPIASYIEYIIQAGIKKKANGDYDEKSLPPITFEYNKPEIDCELKHIDSESLQNLPQGLSGSYQFIDLEGEGLPGIFIEEADAWFYKENRGNGSFGPIKKVSEQPQHLQQPQLVDIDGDGNNELLVSGLGMNGYYSYKDGKWESYKTFSKNLNFNISDPKIKQIDLTGDGRPDILIAQDNVFCWHESLSKDGYNTENKVIHPCDENRAPRVLFTEATQSLFLSDMSGDGLTDIVRIRNGEVCYWPNLGYGRFGAKIVMDNAPQFDTSDMFNPRYIKLGDIDGSGTTDIFYFGNSTAKCWLNQSGNSFIEVDSNKLTQFLPVDSATSISIIDLLGRGTSSIVWSTTNPGNQHLQMSYLDLMSQGKPHLMTKITNNMGKETLIEYKLSTEYYLEDKSVGKDWITKLPFPVHVINKVTTRDLISDSYLTTQYRYHHGYFDGPEREFRGFGMVETIDTETFTEYSKVDDTFSLKNYVAPILTKQWFHTGAFLNMDYISKQYENEYYNGDSNAFLLPDTVIVENDESNVSDITADEIPQAYRALKSSVLRTEVYEVGKPDPYQVTETNYFVKKLQDKSTNKHAVFFTAPRETITFHYEQNANDPRIGHEFVLEVDPYGNVLKKSSLVYPRRIPNGVTLDNEQTVAHLTCNVNKFINETTFYYRIGVPAETRAYEVGVTSTLVPDATTQVSFEAMELYLNDGSDSQLEPGALLPNNIISFSDTLDSTLKKARLLDWNRTFFWNDDQSGALDNGVLPEIDKVLMHHVENAIATPDLFENTYAGDISTTDIENAKYLLLDGYYWNPGLIQHYTDGHFYLPIRTEDPFCSSVTVEYDDYDFIPVKTVDALGNESSAEIDYRTLQPKKLIDPNNNTSEAITDPLGMVIATSVYEKDGSLPEHAGDLPLDSYVEQENPSISNIKDNAETYLQTATTFFYYDLNAWIDRLEPVQFIQLAREHHVSEFATNATLENTIQISIGYSDGFGRELQSKLKVESGNAETEQPDGTFEPQWCDNRWLTSGRTVYNNKEKPIKQYEPFYSTTHEYQDEEYLANFGVTPVIHYDPLLRVVQTDLPDGNFTKVEFTPWQVITYDQNDTFNDSGNLHYNTPSVSNLDTLGRQYKTFQFLSDFNLLMDPINNPPIPLLEIEGGYMFDENHDDVLVTKTTFDISGKPIKVWDPKLYEQYVNDSSVTPAFQYTYDMLEQVLRTQNVDAGDDKVFTDVMGKPVKSFDAKGHTISIEYDELHRPTSTTVSGNGLNNVTEKITYGEEISNNQALNLRGQVYQHFDQAGCTTVESYTFKGEVPESKYQLRVLDSSDYSTEVDWNTATLETEEFSTSTTYDALGRVVSQLKPDGSTTYPEFHQSGKLNAVNVDLKSDNKITSFVSSITYNAKGQRENIKYGNGTETDYIYEEETFRLSSLKTIKDKDETSEKVLQDITYVYDPVGNITEITDYSHEKVFHSGQVVEPKSTFTYDALYRLTKATGREHLSLNNPVISNYELDKYCFTFDNSNPNDLQALANYERNYQYDKNNNLKQIQHQTLGAGNTARNFTRDILPADGSNKAVPTDMLTGGAVPEDFFDANGNCTNLDHLETIEYNYRDNISKVKKNGVSDYEYYIYNSSGDRVRRITVVGSEVTEKIYLGGVEIKKISSGSSLILERWDHHVMDDASRIAIVNYWETDTLNREVNDASEIGVHKIRYQYGNHLGSASLELDDSGNVISYEEYFPYGGSAFIYGDNLKEVKLKEYRFTGKERDEFTGLYYFGARYYAPWIGRWMSADPAGAKGSGLNMYWYASDNPIKRIDPTGMADEDNVYASLDNIDYGVTHETEEPDHSAVAESEISDNEMKNLERYSSDRGKIAYNGAEPVDELRKNKAVVEERAKDAQIKKSTIEEKQERGKGSITDNATGSAGLAIATAMSDDPSDYEGNLPAAERNTAIISLVIMAVTLKGGGKGGGGKGRIRLSATPSSKGQGSRGNVNVSKAKILRELRQNKSPEALATSKLIKRGKVNINIVKTDPHGGGAAARASWSPSKDIFLAKDKISSVRDAAGYTVHEAKHILQKLSPSTYRKHHELEAYMWQKNAGYLNASKEQLKNFINNSSLYSRVKGQL